MFLISLHRLTSVRTGSRLYRGQGFTPFRRPKELIVACTTKYTGDLELRIAHECIDEGRGYTGQQ